MQETVDFNEDVRRQRMPWAMGPFLWLPQVAACPERVSSARSAAPPREEEAGNRDKKAWEMNWPVEAGCWMVESPELSPS